MDLKVYREYRKPDDNQELDERRSRVVHRIGNAGTGLFPGWGPKF